MTTHDAPSAPASTHATATAPAPALRRLGRSELMVSPLCLGTNTFGWTTDERESFAVLDAYVDAGGTFIDTADMYATWANDGVGGQSETMIGRWLASRRRPPGLVIATKIGKPMPYGSGIGPAHLRRALDESLTRLGVDHVDLLYTHEDNIKVPQADTMQVLDEFVRDGKVRVLGASNFLADRIVSANAIADKTGGARYEVVQPPYNLLDRDVFEGDLQRVCVEHQLSVVPYYGLARGFLTGKYQPGAAPPDSQRSAGTLEHYGNDRGWAVLRAVESVAARHDATPAQIALAWCATQPAVASPIASATSPAQIHDMAGMFDLHLDENDLRELSGAGAAGDTSRSTD